MTTEPSLYERLGGMFPIAAVIDHFSDQLLKNPKVVNANPELKEWHTVTYPGRLPGLKFGRTLWACALSGGPFQYTARELGDAHFGLHIAPEVFDEVSAELGRTLDHFNVPKREKEEVLAAFNSFKPDVTTGNRITEELKARGFSQAQIDVLDELKVTPRGSWE